MLGEIEILPLKKRDLRELFLVARVHYPKEPWLNMEYLQKIEKEAVIKLALFSNKRMLGGLIVRRDKFPQAWLDLLVIDKNFLRHGLGERLFTTAERQLIKGTYLWCLVPDNRTQECVKKFLQKMGMQMQGHLKNWFNRSAALAFCKKIK